MPSDHIVFIPAVFGFSVGIFWLTSKSSTYQTFWKKIKTVDQRGVLLPSIAVLVLPFIFVQISSLIRESDQLNDQASLIAVFGTIFGATVTQVGNLLSKRIDRANGLDLKRLEVSVAIERQYIIEPVILYLDEHIKLIQKIYNNRLLKEDISLSDKEYIFNLSAIQARLDVLGDSGINEKFEDFLSLRISQSDESVEDTYKKLKKAIDIEKEILGLLLERVRNI